MIIIFWFEYELESTVGKERVVVVIGVSAFDVVMMTVYGSVRL